MRILFEYTDVFKRPEHNVGIPRVVRNIAHNLHQIEDVECIPIVFRHSRYYDARGVVSRHDYDHWINNAFLRLADAVKGMWCFYNQLCAKQIVSRIPALQKVLFAAFKIGSQPLMGAQKICRATRMNILSKRLVHIDIQPEDVVVWAGSLSQRDAAKHFAPLKIRGTRIIVVMHDLFAMTLADLQPDKKNRPSVPSLLSIADGFVAISTTVRDELQEYLQYQLDIHSDKKPWVDCFYLGSELDLVARRALIRPVFPRFLESHKSVYLMVGTVQPRKNYTYALDAFERLWAANIDVSLCIVGKIGWKCENLIERILNHPEWNRRLFMWNNVNDNELEYCYQHSKALVYSSVAEGFGLPLVEAMQHGLPVMASDIPIFRELGGGFVAFFDLSNPETLCDLIRSFEKNAIFPSAKSIDQWKWITWMESTRQLINSIVRHESKQRKNHESFGIGLVRSKSPHSSEENIVEVDNLTHTEKYF